MKYKGILISGFTTNYQDSFENNWTIITQGLQWDRPNDPAFPAYTVEADIDGLRDALMDTIYTGSAEHTQAFTNTFDAELRELDTFARQFAFEVAIVQLAQLHAAGELDLSQWSPSNLQVWASFTSEVYSRRANIIVDDDDFSETEVAAIESLMFSLVTRWQATRRDVEAIHIPPEHAEEVGRIINKAINDPNAKWVPMDIAQAEVKPLDDGGPAHQQRARDAAASWANDMLLSDEPFVILDLETTGLNDNAEICQIGLLSSNGDVLMNTLVKTVEPIPTSSSNIHGITDTMVQDAPTFDAIYEQLCDLIIDRDVVIYNAAFDGRVLDQVCRRHGLLEASKVIANVHCAMLQYADFRGDWNDYYGTFRWPKLAYAIDEFSIDLGDGKEHDAMTDCRITLELINGMAHYAQPAPETDS